MEILLVISRLLDYPVEALYDEEVELCKAIWRSPLSTEVKENMQSFVWKQLDRDILDVQSEYDGLFERGRSLGLWLFEHVHGESRDRGQAMVDLMDQYRQAGLEIAQHELPDYIPLFLEFISTQGEENARSWLKDVEHILALLLARLEKRESHYSVLFTALLELSNSAVDLSEVRENVNSEKRDDTNEALDKEWEEEEITFGAESVDACTSTRKPSESQRADLNVPVHWVDFNNQNANAPEQQNLMTGSERKS